MTASSPLESLQTFVISDRESEAIESSPRLLTGKLDHSINFVYINYSQGDYEVIDGIAQAVMAGDDSSYSSVSALSGVVKEVIVDPPLLRVGSTAILRCAGDSLGVEPTMLGVGSVVVLWAAGDSLWAKKGLGGMVESGGPGDSVVEGGNGVGSR